MERGESTVDFVTKETELEMLRKSLQLSKLGDGYMRVHSIFLYTFVIV